MWGWGANILPYIEQQNLYNQLNVGSNRLDQTIVALVTAGNEALLQTPLSTYVCPSDQGGPTMDGGQVNGGTGRNFTGVGGLPTSFRVSKSNYVGVCGYWDVDSTTNNGVLSRGSKVRFDLPSRMEPVTRSQPVSVTSAVLKAHG